MNINRSVSAACSAKSMPRETRMKIALEALTRSKTKTALPKEHDVSRHFFRKQNDIGLAAIVDCFTQSNDDVIFTCCSWRFD